MPDNSSQHKQLLEATRRELRQARLELDALQTEIDNLEIKKGKLQTEIVRQHDQLTAVKSENAQNKKKHPAWMLVLLIALGLGYVINIALTGPALFAALSALRLPFVPASLPIGSPNDVPSAAPTSTVLPTQSTGTPAVESAPLPVPRVKADTAIRRGPSDRFEAVATAEAGAEIKPVAQSRDGSWVQLSLGLWLPARTIDRLPSLPVARNIPAPPTSTPTPFPEPRVKANVAVRRGPSARFEAVAIVEAGAEIKPVARSRDGSWVQLSLGLWLPARTIDHLPSLPVARNIPALPAASADPPAPPAPTVWATVNNEYGANLREGPGTNFDTVRVLEPGERVKPIARTRDGTWVQSDEGWSMRSCWTMCRTVCQWPNEVATAPLAINQKVADRA